MKRLALFLLLISFLWTGAQAKVVLHHLIGDNMVLQQQTRARVWGTAEPLRTVRITPSWSGKPYTVKADRDGRWEAFLDTPAAGMTPYEITFSDGQAPVRITNVLIGEVWVAGGQSNMEMPVRGFGNCPVEGYNDAVAESAAFPAIRYAKIPSVTSMVPLDDADTKWNVISPETVPWTSAVGYFFARRLFLSLGIPVGIIEANKGGTRVEGWLSKENLEAFTKEPLDQEGIERVYPTEWHRPLVWGNGTFHPVLKYTVKGILFYQGCSNVGTPGDLYSERLALLVRQWREAFGLGDIPFHFVQICPFGGNGSEDEKSGTWVSLLQEQQFKASRMIPNSGLVCTTDCVYPYEVTQIHPAQKRKVGERLAFLTLNRTYGMTSFGSESPSFREMEMKEGKIYVSFDHMEGGVNRMLDIRGFEVAGEDRIFHPAVATVKGDRVCLSSPDVPEPVSVRYAFHNWPEANFGNAMGLPLFPFRSDNWER